MWRKFIQHDARIALLSLAGATVLGVGMVAARTVLNWRGEHLYLVWNLFLAWIPMLLALRVEGMQQRGVATGWHFWAVVTAWLLFFPNAPYIFTDLTHLKLVARSGWWTDLIVILFFAVIGLVLAFVSLHRMQNVVAQRHGWLAGWAFVLVVAFLSGFGVYLGRFERWNSWDVVMNPIGLLADSFNWVDRHSAKFTVLFGVFLSTAYALLYSLTLLGPGARVSIAAPKNVARLLEA